MPRTPVVVGIVNESSQVSESLAAEICVSCEKTLRGEPCLQGKDISVLLFPRSEDAPEQVPVVRLVDGDARRLTPSSSPPCGYVYVRNVVADRSDGPVDRLDAVRSITRDIVRGLVVEEEAPESHR